MDGDYDDDDFWETGISRPLKRSDSHVSAGNIYGKLDGSGDVDVGTVDGGTGPGGVGSIGGDTSGGGGGIVMELTAATGSEQPGASAFQRKAKLRKSVMFSDDTWPIMSPTGRHSPGKHSGEEEEDGVDTEMAASGWAAVTTTTTSMTAVTHSSVGLSGTGRKKREIMTGKAARVSSDFDGGSRSGGGGGGASNSGTSGTSIFGSSSCDSNHSISRSNSSCSSSSSGSSNYSSSSSSSSSSSTCQCSNGSSDSGGGGKGVDDDNNNDDDDDDNHSDVDVEGGGDDDGSDSDGRDMILELQRLHQQQHSPRRKKTTSKQEEEEDEEGAAKSSRSNNSSRSSRQMRRRHSSQSGRQKLEETLTVDSLLEGHYGQLVKLCLEEIKVDDEASRRHIHARQMEQLYSTYIAVGNKQLALTPVALYPHGWPRYVTRRLFYPPPSSATPSMVQWECSRRGESGSSTTAFSTACSMSLGENEIRHERRNQRLLNGTRRVQNNRKLFRAKTTVGPQKSSVNPSSSRGIFDQHENIPTAPPPTAAATKPTSSAMSKKKLSGSSSTSSSGRGSFVRQKKLPLQTASEENAANQTCRSVDNSFRPNDSNPHILKWLQKKDKDFWQQKREMKVRKKLETENRKLDAAFKADRQLRSSAAFEEWMHHKAKGKKFLSASSTAKSSIDVSQEPKQSPKPTYGFPFMSKEQHEGEGDDDAGVQEQTLSAPQKGSGFVKAGKSLLHEENLEVNFLRMTNLQNWQTKNPVSNFTSSQAETGTDVPLDNPESSTRFADCGVDQNKEELEIASKTEKHNVWQMKRLGSEHKKSSLIFQQPDEDNGRNQGKEQSFYGKPESQSSSPPTPLPLVMKKSTTRPKTAHGRRSRCSAATSRDKCLVSPQLMPLPSL